jgi:hypothetical protein
MPVITSIKVRHLQRTLYRKAKGNPKWRAWNRSPWGGAQIDSEARAAPQGMGVRLGIKLYILSRWRGRKPHSLGQ